MVLVDHQIAGGQVGEGVHLPAVGGVLEPLALFPGAVRPLGEHGVGTADVVKPGGQPPHGDGDAPRLGQAVELEVHGGTDLPLPQEGLEVQGPLLAAHQHHRPGAGGLELAEVGGRRVQAGPEGGELPPLGGEHRLGGQGGLGGGEGVQEAQAVTGELGHEIVHPGGKDGVPAVHRPVLDEGFHVLPQLPQPVPAPLRHPAGLGQAHNGVRGQVVGGGGQGLVPGGQIPVGQPLPLAVFVPDGQKLAHREELRPVQLACPPLGGHVEQPHGVHVPVPELHPDGAVHAGGEHI